MPKLSKRAWIASLIALACLPGSALSSTTTCEDALDAQELERVLKACRQQSLVSETRDRIKALISTADDPDQLLGMTRDMPDSPLRTMTMVRAAELDVSDRRYERATDLYAEAASAASDQVDWPGLLDATYGSFTSAFYQADYQEMFTLGATLLEYLEQHEDARIHAGTLFGLFNAVLDMGDYRTAEQILTEAIVYAPRDHPQTAGVIATNRSVLYLHQERYEEALAVLDEFHSQPLGGASPHHVYGTYLNAVDALSHLGRLDEMKAMLDKARQLALELDKPIFALEFHDAHYQLGIGNSESSLQLFDKVLSDPELPEIWKWESHHGSARALEGSGDKLAARDRYWQAIAALEDLRTGVNEARFRAYLVSRSRQPYEALFELLVSEGDTDAAWTVYERSKARAFVDALIDLNQASESSSLSSSLQQVQNRMAMLADVFSAGSTAPVTHSAAQVESLNILSYFQTSEALYVLSSIRGERKILPIQVDMPTLERDIAKHINSGRRRETATKLGELLLPQQALPAPGEVIHVVADGSIGNLNVAALQLAGEFLVERNPVVHMPGITTHIAAQDRSADIESASVFGDPRKDLPKARLEASYVANVTGVQPIVGEEATVAAVKRAASSQVVHVATHSGVDEHGPWLQLADGNLRFQQILNLGFTSELVFLASCESTVKDGNDLWGSLAVAFLAGGADAVVGSLRPVPDRNTGRIVQWFYDRLAAGDSTPQALANAQIRSIEARIPPQHWSAFILLSR